MPTAVDLFWDAENSTDGTAMTTAIMDAATHLNGAIGSWGVIGASPNYAVATAGQNGYGTRQFTVGGTPYTDSAGTRGMAQNHANQGGIAKYFQFNKSVGTGKVSMAFWFNTGIPFQGFESYTLAGLIDTGFTGGSMFNLQNFGASSHETYIENVSSEILQGPSLSRNTWYLISLLYDKANNLGKLAIYDTSFVQVGSTVQQRLTSGTPGDCTQYRLGSFGGNFPTPAATTYYDGMAVDTSGTTFPLLPTVAASGGIRAPFSFNWWNNS